VEPALATEEAIPEDWEQGRSKLGPNPNAQARTAPPHTCPLLSSHKRTHTCSLPCPIEYPPGVGAEPATDTTGTGT